VTPKPWRHQDRKDSGFSLQHSDITIELAVGDQALASCSVIFLAGQDRKDRKDRKASSCHILASSICHVRVIRTCRSIGFVCI
jgi:hypothetical protein